MPGSSTFNSKTTKNVPSESESNITVKKEPISSCLKDLKGSIDSLKFGSSSRLPSFRRPRDLTLTDLSPSTSTAIQPQVRPKKTFQPNIPVRRDKTESLSESKSEKSGKKIGGKSSNAPNVRGRGRGRGREKEYVQMKGTLFGEGIAAGSPLRRSTDSHGGSDGSKGSGTSKAGEMQKPVLNPDAAYNIDKDLEEKKLKEILRDDFIDCPDDVTCIGSLPVQLPLVSKCAKSFSSDKKPNQENTVPSSESKTFDNVKLPVKVKKEPGLEDENMDVENKISTKKLYGSQQRGAPFNNFNMEFSDESTAHSLLSGLETDLMKIQLPTALPAHPPETNETAGPSTSSGSKFLCDKSAAAKPRCTIDCLPDGQLGNLRVYESGKVELCLGDHIFEMNQGVPRAFVQDVVEIDVDERNKTGNMLVLGHINDYYVVDVDFVTICNKLKS